MRALALSTLLNIERTGAKLSEAENAALKKYPNLPKEKRAFYTRLVEGTLEQKLLLDYIIGIYSVTPVKKLKPAIINILRMAMYQIREMKSVPDSAAVNEAVRLAGTFGFSNLKGFVNGVLRTAIRQSEIVVLPDKSDALQYISVRYSMPEFIAEQWINKYGLETTEKICKSFFEDKRTTIRVRGSKDEIDSCVRSIKESGVEIEKAPYPDCAYYISNYDRITDIREFKEGKIIVQDASSQLAVIAAGIKPGDRILDVCAAPGGKSIFAADLTGGEGEVLARDISEAKLNLIRQNINRCGIKNIALQVFDAAAFDKGFREAFDVVLVDAPCSGYGIIGKKPDIKYNASAEKQMLLGVTQRLILNTAADYVRPGGRLIYSTCTITESENDDKADFFLEQNTDFKPYYISKNLPADLGGTDFARLQLLPGINQCDGFFIAGFEKQ